MRLLLLQRWEGLTLDKFVDRILRNPDRATNLHEVEVLPTKTPISKSSNADSKLLRRFFKAHQFSHDQSAPFLVAAAEFNCILNIVVLYCL